MTDAIAAHSAQSTSVARYGVIGLLVILASYHVLLMLSTVAAFGLRYPFQDQFRLNLRYLTVPFPQSILALENGHRPVLPGIVRLVELKYLDGTQALQWATSWLAAAALVIILLLALRRDLARSALIFAAGICGVLTLLGWNSNARMYIHAYEAMHVFYVTFFVVLATSFVVNGDDATPLKACLLAIAACVGATFSFGPGIASFASILAVALLRRYRLALLTAMVVAALATFFCYFLVLPGSEGVQGGVRGFSPHAAVFFSVARIGAVFYELLRLVTHNVAIQTLVAAAAGGLSLCLFVMSVATRWWNRTPFAKTELFGVGLVAFGVTANALIAVSRAAYFFEYTDQLFADRYLFWSCVTWVGITMYALPSLIAGSQRKQYAAALLIAALSLAAILPARDLNGWSAEVFRLSELTGIALRLGIHNDDEMAPVTGGDAPSAYDAFDEMQRRHLGVLGSKFDLRLGDRIHVEPPEASVAIRVVSVSSGKGRSVRAFSGELPPTLVTSNSKAEVWLADQDGALIGFGELMTTGTEPRNVSLLGIPRMLGFQGYVVRTGDPETLIEVTADGKARSLAHLAHE